MVRGTRYLLVRNLPEKSTEESIINHFQRYGKIQSVRVHNGKENEGGATVAFMDIKSAAKAHNAENNIDGSVVQTEYCEGTATGSVVTRTREPERGTYHATTPRSSSSTTTATFSNWQKGQDENSRHEAESGELPPPTNFSTESEFNRSRPREKKYGKFNQNRQSDGLETSANRSKSGSRSPRSRSHSSSSDSSSSDSTATPSQSRSRASSPNSMRPPGQKKSPGQLPTKEKELKYVEKAASEAGSTSTQPTNSEKRPVGICVTKLPTRSSDTSLRDGLFHEYKKHGKVTSVQVISDDGERYAIVSFRKPEDASKAMEASQDKMFFGTKIHVIPHEGIEVDDADFRPIETELDEYHPKSTRTLFVGNLEKDTSIQELVDKFKPFGEIIDVDIKRQGAASAYAFVQYADILSVVKSLRSMEGEHIGANKIKLGFGKSMPTNCIWLDNIGENVGDNFLLRVFSRYGEVNYSVIDRVKGRSLVYFTNMDNAIHAVSDMKNRSVGGKKIQIDFASRECQNKFFDKMESSGQLRAGERPDERGRGGPTVHRTQSRDYENFSDDSRSSYSQSQTFTNNRSQTFFRGSRSSSRGTRFRSTGEASTFTEEYPSRRASRHSDEYSNSGDYYKADDTYEQELREYDRSRRERRERGTSSPRRDERHLSISFDDRSHRSRDVSLDRYDDRNKEHYDHYRDSDSAGSERNSYHSDSKYHSRSAEDKNYSHRKYVNDKGRCHDLDVIGDGDDGSRSQSPSSFHSPSRTPIPRRSSTPPTPTEAEPPMYRSSYYGDSDYKRKSRLDKPTEFVQHPVQGETVTKSLHSVVCKPVTEVQKQDKSATRKRSYGEAMLSKDTLRSDYKIPRKIDSTISSLVTKTSNSQERSRIEKKLYHTDKKLEKAKYAKHEKLLLPTEAGFMLSSSPGSSGSRPDSENGSMGESDLLKLTQEKKALLQKLEQLEDGGSTSDNESNEDVRNVIARNQKSALSKTLFLKDNLKQTRTEDKKIDSSKSYRRQMEKLRKLQNPSAKTPESSVKINFNGDESDTEEYADDSPKEISPEFRQTKRRKYDKEGESVVKSRPYRRKGSALSSDEEMESSNQKKSDSYAGRLHRIDTNSVLKLISDTDEIQNKAKVQDSKHETNDHPVPNLLSPMCSRSAQSPDREPVSAAFAKPSDYSRAHLHINIGQDTNKSGDIASPMSPPIGGEKHSLNSVNQDVNTNNSEDMVVPTDPRLDEKRLGSDSRYANRLSCNSVDESNKDTCAKGDDSLSDSSIDEPKIPGELSISERIRLLDAQLDKAPDPPAIAVSSLASTLTPTPTISSNIYTKFKIKKRGEASANSANSSNSDKSEPSDIMKMVLSRRGGSILDQDSQRLEERKSTPPGMQFRTKAAAKEISIPTTAGYWQGQMGGMRFQPAHSTGLESPSQSLQSDNLAHNMTSVMAAANPLVVQQGQMSLSPGSQFSASSSPFHPSQSPQFHTQQLANQFSLPGNQLSPGNTFSNINPTLPVSQQSTIQPESTSAPPYSLTSSVQYPVSNNPSQMTSQHPIYSEPSSASEVPSSPLVDQTSSSHLTLPAQYGSLPTGLTKQNNSPGAVQPVFGSQMGFPQPIRPEAMKPAGLFNRRPSDFVASIQIPLGMQESSEGFAALPHRSDSMPLTDNVSSSSSPAFADRKEYTLKSQPPVLKKETNLTEIPITAPQIFPKSPGMNRFKTEDDRLGKSQTTQIGFQQSLRPEVMKPSGLFSRRPSDAVASVQIPSGFNSDVTSNMQKRMDSSSNCSTLSTQGTPDKNLFDSKSQPPVLKKEVDNLETTFGAPAQLPPAEPQSISSTTIIKPSSMNRSKSEDDRPQKNSRLSTSHNSSFDLFEKKIEIFHEKKSDLKKHQDNKDHVKKDKTEGKTDDKNAHSKNTSPDKKSKSKDGDKKDSDKKHEKDKSRHHSGSKDKTSKEKEGSSSKDKSKSSKSKEDKKEHASSSDKGKSQEVKKKDKKPDDKKHEDKDKKHEDKDKKHEDKDKKHDDKEKKHEDKDKKHEDKDKKHEDKDKKHEDKDKKHEDKDKKHEDKDKKHDDKDKKHDDKDKKHEDKDKKHEDKDKKHEDKEKKHEDKDKKHDDKKPDKKEKVKHQDPKTPKGKTDSSEGSKSEKTSSKSTESKADSKSEKTSKDQKDHKKHSSHSKDKSGKEAKDGKSKGKEDKNKEMGSKEKEKEKKKKEKERAEKHAKEKEKAKEKEPEIPYEIPPELLPFISMYDKVKRGRKRDEHEEANKKVKDKRKKEHFGLSDDSDFSKEMSDSDSATSPGIMSDDEKPKEKAKKKRPAKIIDSFSSDDDDMPYKVKRKKKPKTASIKNRKIFDSSSESDKTMDYQTEGSEDEYVPNKRKKSPAKKRKSREESSEIDLHDGGDNKTNRFVSSEMSVTEPETMDEGEKKDAGKSDKEKKGKKKKDKDDVSKEIKQKSKSIDAPMEVDQKVKHEPVKTKAEFKKVESFEEKNKKSESKKSTKDHKKSSKTKAEDKEKSDDSKSEHKEEKNELSVKNKKDELVKRDSSHKLENQKLPKPDVKKTDSKKDEDKKNNSHKSKEEKELKKEVKSEASKESKIEQSKDIKTESKDKSKSDKKKKKHGKSTKSIDIQDCDLDDKITEVEEPKSDYLNKLFDSEIKKEKVFEDSNKNDSRYHSLSETKQSKSDSNKSEMKVKTKAEMKDYVKHDIKVKSEKKDGDKNQKHDRNKSDGKTKSENKGVKQEKTKNKVDAKKSSKSVKEIDTSFKDVKHDEEKMDAQESDIINHNDISEIDQPSQPKKAKISADLKAQEDNLFSKFGPASEIYSSQDEDSENEDRQSSKKMKKKKTKKHKKGEKSAQNKNVIEELKEDTKKCDTKNKDPEVTDSNHKKEKKKGKKKTKEKIEEKIDTSSKSQPISKPKSKPVDPFDFDAFDRSESNDSLPTRLDVKSFPHVAEQIDKLDKHETMSESTTEEAIDSVGEKLNDSEDEKCPDSPKLDDAPAEPPKPPEKPEGLFDKFFEAVHMKKMKNILFDKKPEPAQSAKEPVKEMVEDTAADTSKDLSKDICSVIKSPVQNEQSSAVASPVTTSSSSPVTKLSPKIASSANITDSMSPTKISLSCLSPLNETIPSLISPLKSPITMISPSRHPGPISSTKPVTSPNKSSHSIPSSPGKSPQHSGISPQKASVTTCLSPIRPAADNVPVKGEISSPKLTVLQTSTSPVKIPVLTPSKPVNPLKSSLIIPDIDSSLKPSIPVDVSTAQDLETPFMDEIDSDEREKAVQEASDEAARAVESLLQESSDPDPFGFSAQEIDNQRSFPDPTPHSQTPVEELVFPDVNFSDTIATVSADEPKKQSPVKSVMNRRRSKGSKGSKDDSDTAPEMAVPDVNPNPISEDLLEPESELKIDFDHINSESDNIPNDTGSHNQSANNLSSGLDDSFSSNPDESRTTRYQRESRANRGKGKASRRGRGAITRKPGIERLPVKDSQPEKERPQFGSPVRTDPISIFETSLKEDSDSLVIDEDNQNSVFESFQKELETPTLDAEKSDSGSYKDQRPTRKRKPTNYKDIHAGTVPNTSQSPRTTRAGASPRAVPNVAAPVTSPRTRASASSPRAQRSGMAAKPVSSPRGQKSPKYSDIVSPVVKLEIIDISKSKKREEAKKNIFGKDLSVKDENVHNVPEEKLRTTAFEDWKNSQSLIPEKPNVSKENVYEFEESEDFNTNPCTSLRLRNKKKPVNELESQPVTLKPEEPIVVSQPNLTQLVPKDPLHTVNMEIHPSETANAQAYGSDDSSASMSNVERIIHAVSKGIFGSAEKSDDEDDDEPKLHIAIGGASSPPVSTKSEAENMYNSQFITSGMDFLDKTPPRMDSGFTSPPTEAAPKPEVSAESGALGPTHPVIKSSPESQPQQPWPLTSVQTLPFQPMLTTVDMTLTATTSVSTSSPSPTCVITSNVPERTVSQPLGPAPALIPSAPAIKTSQVTTVQSTQSSPVQKTAPSIVATSSHGTVSSRSMPSPHLLQHKTWNVPVQPILTPPPPQMSPNTSMQPQRPQSVQLPVQHAQPENIVQRSPSVHSYPAHIQLQMQQQHMQIQQQHLQQFVQHQKQLQQHQQQQQQQQKLQQQQQQLQQQQHQQQQQQQKAHQQESSISRDHKEPKRSTEKGRLASQSNTNVSPYPFPAHSGHRQPTAPGFIMQRPVFPNDGPRHGIPIEHPRPGVTGELPKHGLPGESAVHNVPGHHRDERHRPSVPTSRSDLVHQLPPHSERPALSDRSRHPSGDHLKHMEQSRHHSIPPEPSRHQAVMGRIEQRPTHTSSPMDISRGMMQPNMVPTSAHQQRKTSSTPDGASMKMIPPTSNTNTLYAGVVAGQPISLSPKSASPVGQAIERIQNPGRPVDHHGIPHHVKHQQGNFPEGHLIRSGKEPESPRPVSIHGDVRGSREMMFMSQSHQHRAAIIQQQEAAAAAALKSGQMPEQAHRIQTSSPSPHPIMTREQIISHAQQQQSPLNLAETESRSSREKAPSRNATHSFNYPGNGKHLQPVSNQIDGRLPQSKAFLPGFPPRGIPQSVPQLYGVEMPGFSPHGPFSVRLPVDPHAVYQGGVHREQFRDIVPLHHSPFPQQILSPHPGYPLDTHAVPTVVGRAEESSPHGHRQESPIVRAEMMRPGIPRESPKGSGNVFHRYPVMWQGPLALKNDSSFVQMHFVAGNQELVKLTLPQLSTVDQVPLRIAQRMRMEQTQLEGVSKRMQMDSDYCLLLAVPCGRDHIDVAQQTKGLTEGFIQYLQLKQAAGIVNIPMPGSQQPAYVVHIFPPCEFSHDAVARANPVLFENIRDMPHVVIIIVHCDASHA
ncbi:hypothetical protein SNE40_014546 [Patella caerulea]|uniref:Msx2-interacting protein n=1 Tax=Patella caerulea TaxID=87958 RepID=A0AAN8JEW7_PATCE